VQQLIIFDKILVKNLFIQNLYLTAKTQSFAQGSLVG